MQNSSGWYTKSWLTPVGAILCEEDLEEVGRVEGPTLSETMQAPRRGAQLGQEEPQGKCLEEDLPHSSVLVDEVRLRRTFTVALL